MPLDEACCQSGTAETVHLHGYIPRFELIVLRLLDLSIFVIRLKASLPLVEVYVYSSFVIIAFFVGLTAIAPPLVLFLKYDAAGYNPIKVVHYLIYRFTPQRMITWLAILWFERVLHTSWLKERQGVPRNAAAQIKPSIGNND
jgi:hypothetical protein